MLKNTGILNKNIRICKLFKKDWVAKTRFFRSMKIFVKTSLQLLFQTEKKEFETELEPHKKLIYMKKPCEI